jgi:hypothetical protein
MEIQALKLLVTDADLAAVIRERLSGLEGVEGVQAHILPEGVQVQGEYPTGFGFKVPFETVWGLSAAAADVQARLNSIKVAGIPGNMLRGALMRMIRDAAEGQPGVRVEEEAVRINVAALAAAHGAELGVNFTEVRLSVGALVVEAG